MQIHEGRPESINVFLLLRESVEGRLAEAEKARQKAGREIREQTRIAVSTIGEGVLPESIKIADLTPVSSSRPTVLTQAKYAYRTNEISVVTRDIAVITEYRETDPFAEHLDPEETRPIYVPIPEEQQVETIVRVAEDAEWVRYGQSVVEHLESAVLRAQDAKKL